MDSMFSKKDDVIKVCNVLYDDFFIIETDNTEDTRQKIVNGCIKRQWNDKDVRLIYPTRRKENV